MLNYRQQRRAARLEMAAFISRFKQKNDIDRLVEMVLAVMNAVAVSGTNPELMMRKLRRIMSVNKDKVKNHANLVYCIPAMTNVYCYGFVDYLHVNFPDLSEQDVIFCCLIALGASSNCVSMVFGYEHYVTFYNKRAKLRRKMNIETPQELEDYIEDVVAKLEQKYSELSEL